MTERIKKAELLAPAGNFEKLQIAIHYGADAVYLADQNFSLRNFSENFTIDELASAVAFSRKHGVKVYVACNIYSRNAEQKDIRNYLKKLSEVGPDAVIVADPGIFMEARTTIPQIRLHLSTQANTTNYKSAMFWKKLGARRINIARELSLNEVKEITRCSGIEIEAFVHGAMCVSYSGRCLLSNFMANRASNQGLCSHPCRWKYALVEELRPGEYFPFAEDRRGAYIFNSKDLCMIEHIPEMLESGIVSLKIEGRMKGIHYLASTVKVYREAIDAYIENPEKYEIKERWLEELERINHRGYCTGFYFGDPDQISPAYEINKNRNQVFLGKVIDNAGEVGVNIDVRNKIFQGEIIEVLGRKGPARQDKIIEILGPDGKSIPFAQPGSKVMILLDHDCLPNDIIRRIEAI